MQQDQQSLRAATAAAAAAPGDGPQGAHHRRQAAVLLDGLTAVRPVVLDDEVGGGAGGAAAAGMPGKPFDGNGSAYLALPSPKPPAVWREVLARVWAPTVEGERRSRQLEIEAVEAKLEALRLTGAEALRRGAERRRKVGVAAVEDPALVPLSEEAEARVDDALGNGVGSEILASNEAASLDISRTMMKCLRPGCWLNDEVSNFYLQLLKERELRAPGKYPKCHFFNTFFYNKLFRDKQKYDYKSVRRWTTPKKVGYKLYDCDKVIVPIHQGIHWTLAIIDLSGKSLHFLDSLHGLDGGTLVQLAKYIRDEALDKGEVVLDASSWPQSCPSDIPEQLNSCDCGVFMLKYADYCSRGAPLTFSQMEHWKAKADRIMQLCVGASNARALLIALAERH
eukprot:SM000308S11823  [mRNA]  locus=s308:121653:124435:+ [translate_table: standard]